MQYLQYKLFHNMFCLPHPPGTTVSGREDKWLLVTVLGYGLFR